MPKSGPKPQPSIIRGRGAVQQELLDLLPVDLKRWSPRRKAVLIGAVKSRLLTIESACEIYGLTEEEIRSWQTQVEKFGPQGLFVTRIQRYRENSRRRKPKA